MRILLSNPLYSVFRLPIVAEMAFLGMPKAKAGSAATGQQLTLAAAFNQMNQLGATHVLVQKRLGVDLYMFRNLFLLHVMF